ncbi:MAG: chemotaxis protein CheW, partial [Magnetococcales bacterium]|nr:chemotaxis protein CheW [Magnetococcales bacterium]
MMKLLTFKLDNETFGVDIDEVQEVLEYIPLTAVPGTDANVKGIIRLRGVVVPVVDLRQRLGRYSIEPTRSSAIVIMDLPWRRGSRYFGALVDGVEEVVDMLPQSLLPPPRTGQQPGAGYIRSMGRHGEKFVMILDTRTLFSFAAEEVAQEKQSTPDQTFTSKPEPEEENHLLLPNEDLELSRSFPATAPVAPKPARKADRKPSSTPKPVDHDRVTPTSTPKPVDHDRETPKISAALESSAEMDNSGHKESSPPSGIKEDASLAVCGNLAEADQDALLDAAAREELLKSENAEERADISEERADISLDGPLEEISEQPADVVAEETVPAISEDRSDSRDTVPEEPVPTATKSPAASEIRLDSWDEIPEQPVPAATKSPAPSEIRLDSWDTVPEEPAPVGAKSPAPNEIRLDSWDEIPEQPVPAATKSPAASEIRMDSWDAVPDEPVPAAT